MKSLAERLKFVALTNADALVVREIDAMFVEFRAELSETLAMLGASNDALKNNRGSLAHAYLAMKAAEPKPPVEITDETVERATRTHFEAQRGAGYISGTTRWATWDELSTPIRQEKIECMRAALQAALNPPAEETR